MKKASQSATLKKAIGLAIIFACIITNSFSQAKTGHAPVNGLKIYYEVAGSGKPIVLLHGACNTINTAFGQLITGLSKTRQVIAVELQGHGRTAGIDRPFSFENMADDVAALLKFLKTDSADIFGYTMGGVLRSNLQSVILRWFAGCSLPHRYINMKAGQKKQDPFFLCLLLKCLKTPR